MSKAVIVRSAGVLVMLLASLASAAQDRPNILFAFADDWGWPHASVYGDPAVETPTFDRIARQGALFTHAFVDSPSCTPSRGAVLSGQHIWRLREGANLWSTLDQSIPLYTDLLMEAGYAVGHSRKGWGPGKLKPGNRQHNPAGPKVANFKQFLDQREDEQPFCFWFGSKDPHRPYQNQLRRKMGIDPADVDVPPYLPDVRATRHDMANYYAEVERFDKEVANLVAMLKQRGELDNTIVVITGDHGMPFPRCKGNLYDSGARVPLAIHWPGEVAGGQRITKLVNLIDLAPTFLKAAGEPVPNQMNGQSLLPMLRSTESEKAKAGQDAIVFGRERHVPAQANDNAGGYPARAIRTPRYLYIRNFKPDRWPAGTPNWQNAYGPRAWLADCDNGPTKFYMWAHRDQPDTKRLYELSFAKRPAEELYDLREDPHQMNNVADQQKYASIKERLKNQLMQRLKATDDPRATDQTVKFDDYPYHGGFPSWPGQSKIDEYR
jgi:arylsulfatase A-like enzyme